MKRLWIVEARISYEKGGICWEVCDFGLGKYSSTNFYEAYQIKREQQKYLQEHGSSYWTKNKFRVVEYVRKKGGLDVR